MYVILSFHYDAEIYSVLMNFRDTDLSNTSILCIMVVVLITLSSKTLIMLIFWHRFIKVELQIIYNIFTTTLYTMTMMTEIAYLYVYVHNVYDALA